MSLTLEKLKTASSQNSCAPMTWAEIDLDALRCNLRLIRKMTRSEVLAVVKADAYGHGMDRVAATLAAEGVDFFGVANIDEAVQLRRVCASASILTLGSFHPSQVGRYASERVIPTVSSAEDALIIKRRLGSGTSMPVHVKVDTGMGRLGVWHEEAIAVISELLKVPQVRIDGVYTHLSSADSKDPRFTERQLERFESVLAWMAGQGVRPRYVHAANSMGTIRFSKAHLNLVRPGIALYGVDPAGRDAGKRGLKPVLSLRSKVSFLKEMGAGRTVSYGATHRTSRSTFIAALPVGYSHGYRVAFSNRASVLIGGRRYPVVGRVTMDQTLVDVGARTRVRRWDEVTLIGRDGRQKVSAEELARIAGTIPYEVLCAIHPRIPRVYKEIGR